MAFETEFGTDQDPELALRDEVRHESLGGLGQRISLLALLLPCLAVAAIVYLFVDFNTRLARIDDSGSVKVQDLSRGLQREMAAVTEKMALVEKGIQEKLAAQQAQLDDIQKELKNLSESTDALGRWKADQDQAAGLREQQHLEIQGLLAELQKKAGELEAAADANAAGLTETLPALRKAVEALEDSREEAGGKWKEMERQIEGLDKSALRRTEIKTLLKDQQEQYEKQVSEKLDAVRKALDSMGSRIDALELDQAEAKIKKSSSTKPESAAGKQGSTRRRGDILEQDIKR